MHLQSLTPIYTIYTQHTYLIFGPKLESLLGIQTIIYRFFYIHSLTLESKMLFWSSS